MYLWINFKVVLHYIYYGSLPSHLLSFRSHSLYFQADLTLSLIELMCHLYLCPIYLNPIIYTIEQVE